MNDDKGAVKGGNKGEKCLKVKKVVLFYLVFHVVFNLKQIITGGSGSKRISLSKSTIITFNVKLMSGLGLV